MKFTITRKELFEGLQVVSRAVSAHTSLPVLKNVLIEAAGDGVKLCATDLEVGVEVRVPAAVQEAGSLTVPARTMGEIVSALPEADVTVAADERAQLLVTCRRAEYQIHGLPAEEFPPLPEVGGLARLEVPQPTLARMIRQTVFAASDDDTRPILTGVLLQVTPRSEASGAASGAPDVLRLVATDTHRLAVASWTPGAAPRYEEGRETGGEGSGTHAEGALVVSEPISAIVPARALAELQRVLHAKEEGGKALSDGGDAKRSDGTSPVLVRVDGNQILFRTERVTLISRLIEGQFPGYERVIPTRFDRRLTIQRDEFASALRRLRILARDAAARNRVVLSTRGESLVITTEGEEGRGQEEIEVVREGDDLTIAFNVSYLLDVLGVLETEGVYLELNGPLHPGVIRPVDGEDYLMVVMPMQVD